MKLGFTVPAVPVAQPRARAVSTGMGARVYGAKKSHPVHAFKAAVMSSFSAAWDEPPHDGPVSLSLLFVMPRPSAKVWKTKPMPREAYIAKKNDWDNLGKSVCDALNKLAWVDDGLIWKAEVERVIAAGDEQPHVEVVIEFGEPNES